MKKTAAFHVERLLWQLGHGCVAGLDEVGMGPLAGPVVAAAVVFSADVVLDGLADSKMLTRKQRELLKEFEKEARDNSPQSEGFFARAKAFWDGFGG